VVAERAQHEEGADDLVAVGPAVLDPVGPRLPPLARLCVRLLDVQRFGDRPVGGEPGQHEVKRLTRPDGEGGGVPVVGGVEAHASDDERVGPRHRDELGRRISPVLAHPRHGARVVEADAQLGGELDGAAHADDTAHEVGASDRDVRVGPDRHEVVHLGDAVRRLPAGDEDERVGVVVPARDGALVARPQRPHAVVGTAEHLREDGWGVEAGQAQPLDAALA